jgi:regulator of cell morphogenesis and NO signaling
MEVNALQQVLSRYHQEAVNDLSKLNSDKLSSGIPVSFIKTLKRVFEDENNFRPAAFHAFSLDIIIDYIRRTHKLYLQKKLLEIEQSIHLLLQDYNDQHPLLFILHNFYAAYKKDLTHHINDEESLLLPYIEYLQDAHLNGFDQYTFFEKTRNYSLDSFLNGHDDPDEDLQRVRLSILRYNPPCTNQTPYRILLSQLSVFEKDLAVHALIEEKVLIPRALVLEKALIGSFNSRIRLS